MKKRNILMLSIALCIGFVVSSCNNEEVTVSTDECNVVIEAGQNGTISADKNKGNVGDKITLTITPNANYKLETLSINGTSYINNLNEDSLVFLLVKGENKVVGSFKIVDQIATNRNEDTKEIIDDVFGDIISIPFFNDFVSYEAKKGIDRNASQKYISIIGETIDKANAISKYKTVLEGNDTWSYLSTSSSEELAYYELNLDEKNGYLYFLNNEDKFEIYAGIDADIPTDWSDEDKKYMDDNIGKDLHIPYFYIENSYLEPLYLKGFGTTTDIDGVSYCSSTEKLDAVKDYAEFMKTQDNFVFDEANSTEEEFYFEKDLEENKYFFIDVYLFEGYFNVDGYIYIDTTEPAPVDNITADIELLPTDFYVSSASEYGKDGAIFNKGGMNYSTTLIKKGFETVEAIQFRKTESHFENIYELPPLSSITFDQIVENKGYDGTITVKAGTSKNNLEEVVGENGVFTLSDATYFEISNTSSYACYFKSISFDFKNL